MTLRNRAPTSSRLPGVVRSPTGTRVGTLALLVLLSAGCPLHSPASGGTREPPPAPSAQIEPGSFRPVVLEASGRLFLTFADAVSSGFRLVHIRFALDDEWILACGDGERSLEASAPILVYDGRLATGEHAIHVELAYRGVGEGIFSYLEDYTFRVRSHHDFALPAGAFLALHARAAERGDETTALEDRPFLAFEDRSTDPPRVTPRPGCPWGEDSDPPPAPPDSGIAGEDPPAVGPR